MYILENEAKCTGCEACKNICPKSCIAMEEKKGGFLYPIINEKECINCKLCKKTCPVNRPKGHKNIPNEIYAAYSKDFESRSNSSSGGIFGELAKYIIEKNGFVFGTTLNDDFSAQVISAQNEKKLQELFKSKYVQSHVDLAYQKVESLLQENRVVLFSGTPCQIAGLKSYLGKPYTNLMTIDVVCFGVPSPRIFQKYIHSLEIQQKSKVLNFNFRSKVKGWTGKKFSVEIKFKNNNHFCEFATDNLYHKAFFNGCNVRQSCFDCNFKNGNHESDLTLADYWGVEKYTPEMDDGKGTSLVIINSDKGKKMFNNIDCKVLYQRISSDNAFLDNLAATESKKENKQRKLFLNEMDNCKDEDVIRKLEKYSEVKFLQRVKLGLKHCLGVKGEL